MVESSHVHPINILDIKRPNDHPPQPFLGFDVAAAAAAFPCYDWLKKCQRRHRIEVSPSFKKIQSGGDDELIFRFSEVKDEYSKFSFNNLVIPEDI